MTAPQFFGGKSVAAAIVPVKPWRRFATQFEKPVFPTQWVRRHAPGVTAGPSEVRCLACKTDMLFLKESTVKSDFDDVFASFPAVSLTGNVPQDFPAVSCSAWWCPKCDRGVVATR